MRHLRWPLALAVGVQLTACYHYAPVDAREVPAGEEVRLVVSRGAAERLVPLVPPGARQVEGTLVRSDARRIVVRVRQAPDPTYAAYARRSLGQNVELVPDDVVAVEVRVLDRVRTATVGAVAAGVFGYAVVRLLSGENRAPEPRPGEEPLELRVRWRLPVRP